MANTSSVPSIQFTPTGLVLPTESSILAGVQADYNAAFGGNLNIVNLEAPQGQLCSSTTAIIGDANDTFAEFVNQVDPDVADGFMQDAIARIYFLEREPGIPTVVQCDCVGLFGTVIAAATAMAQDTSGNIYICTGSATIPVSGTVSVSFANVLDGPIACPTGTLTIIYRATPGWDSINNPAPGVEGALVESRAAFEFRRQQSVALNAHGSIQSIQAAAFDVDDVIDSYSLENVEDTVVNMGSTNYPMAPHSIYVAAVGGLDQDIANAIWSKKNDGSNYNGNTTATVVDSNGYSIPYPTYIVKFERPPALPIKFAVQIADSTALPTDIITLVQDAIIAAFVGADGGLRARIGSLILASRFYAPVTLIGPEVSILSILIGPSTPTLNSYLVGIDQAPTVQRSDIAVSLV
jgi:hypothetical protein